MPAYLLIAIPCFAAVLIKSYLNFSKLCSAKKLRKKYEESLKKDGKSFLENIPEAKALFINAGLSNVSIPITQNIGYGKATAMNAKIIDNLDSCRADIVSSVLVLFDELVGFYRMKLKESVSPRYWIETLVFLPSRLMVYIGGNPDNLITKLLQVIYWIATPLLIAFRSKLYDFIMAVFEKL